MNRPTAGEVSDRALVLYALTRRGAIELVVSDSGGDPARVAAAERARFETDRWLERESVSQALTDVERRLFEATSGTWPAEAIADSMWRKESLGVLLWALEHLPGLPGFGEEFDQQALDEAITRYGSVSSFRAEGHLRPDEQMDAAWIEADAWFGVTDGRTGDDASLASISAERFRALSWLRDRDAAPA
jgi:Domain of unknown function (DUF4272)